MDNDDFLKLVINNNNQTIQFGKHKFKISLCYDNTEEELFFWIQDDNFAMTGKELKSKSIREIMGFINSF